MGEMTDRLWEFLNKNAVFSGMAELKRIEFLDLHGLGDILKDKIIQDFPAMRRYFILRNAVQVNINKRLISEMTALNRNANRIGVKLVFLKGPLLGSLLYDPSSVRRTSDIDVLAEYDSIPKVMEMLGDMGYKDRDGKECSGREYLYEFQRGDPRLKITKRHYTCVRYENGYQYKVELHDTPFRNYERCSNTKLREISSEIFGNTIIQTYGDEEFNILGHADSFLMLCCHFARHAVEKITKYCYARSESGLMGLNHLHDLALYYYRYGKELYRENLLWRAKIGMCTADLMISAKYLKEVYGLVLYDELGGESIGLAEDEIEDNVYNALALNFSAGELIFGDLGDVFHRLIHLIPPLKHYHCHQLGDGEFPPADCMVREEYNGDAGAGDNGREMLCFSFGAGFREKSLLLCVAIPEKEVFFMDEVAGSIYANIRIHISFPSGDCQSDGKSCLNEYRIDIGKIGGRMKSFVFLNGEPAEIDFNVSQSDGKLVIHPVFNVASETDSLRFMISCEITLPRPHDHTHFYRFELCWINSVAVSYRSCLTFGELIR